MPAPVFEEPAADAEYRTVPLFPTIFCSGTYDPRDGDLVLTYLVYPKARAKFTADCFGTPGGTAEEFTHDDVETFDDPSDDTVAYFAAVIRNDRFAFQRCVHLVATAGSSPPGIRKLKIIPIYRLTTECDNPSGVSQQGQFRTEEPAAKPPSTSAKPKP